MRGLLLSDEAIELGTKFGEFERQAIAVTLFVSACGD